MDVREKLVEIIQNSVGGCARHWAEVIADGLIAHGVTVQEWNPISKPPKEKGTYLVCTENGGVLLGHWYGTKWNVGGGAKKHLAYWMKKPQPPKGE